MSRPAYIVLTHKRPDLLFRLIDALDGAEIGLHVDKKSDIWPEVQERAADLPNLTLLPRHKCYWGGFGHVRATLEGLKWFLTTDAEHVVLLTGQCYPLRSQDWISAELDRLRGRSVMQTEPFPRDEWVEVEAGGDRRIDRFYFKMPRQWHPQAVKLWTRRLPRGLKPFGGSSYWCLSREAVEYVLDYLDRRPDVLRFFRTTFIPDEMFFQIILGSSPLSDRIVNRPTHFIDWSKGGPNPAIIQAPALPGIMATDCWFTRKFDDVAVLDAVDALMEGQPDGMARVSRAR